MATRRQQMSQWPPSVTDRRLIEFVASERRGRPADARRAWGELVGRRLPTIAAYVRRFRFPGREAVTIPRSEWDDAAQRAAERALRMFSTFKGGTLKEFDAALRTSTKYACMDYCRAAVHRDQHQAGSLDDGWVDGRTSPAVGLAAEKAAVEAFARRQEARERLGATVSAMDGLPDRRMRDVLALGAVGLSGPEIAERLGTSVANVHQLRSRAISRIGAGETAGAHLRAA